MEFKIPRISSIEILREIDKHRTHFMFLTMSLNAAYIYEYTVLQVPYVVEKPYPVTVEKHFPVPIPKPYPVHVPVYKHVFHHKSSGHGWKKH